MKNIKFLNIILLSFVMMLILQMFLPKPQQTITTTPNAYLSIEKDSITVPNIPKITLHNTSSGALQIHPCNDISISVNSGPLENIEKGYPEFCKTIDIPAGQNAIMPLDILHSVFAQKPGKYIFKVQTPFDERNISFTLLNPGFFRSTLSTIVYQPIYNLFVALLTFLPGHRLGWAIIIITLLIRLVLLVPQHRMLINSQKLNAINPKIEALKKEYKGDQAQLGMKLMDLYKKEKINPLGSCLPLLIQIPILFGLYWVISSVADPSNFYHLYSFFDDFQPSAIDTLFFGYDLSRIGGNPAIVAAVALGITQWLQAYLSFSRVPKPNTPPKKPTTEATANDMPTLDPQMMQKMMLYMMPAMIAITAFFFPLGVALYWFIGTVFVILQQSYVNMRLKKKEKTGELIPAKNSSKKDS